MRHSGIRPHTTLVVTLSVAIGAASLLVPACNEHPLESIDAYVGIAVSDSASIKGQTKFDVLWLVDNSNSMCQEQENLARNFSAFADRLAKLQADFRMGVITTDVDDKEAHDGQLQHAPATELTDCIRADFHDPANYCEEDGDCGDYGCRCGIPHLQRCEIDADCPADRPVCVRSSGQSTYRFCSRSCNGPGDESCLAPDAPNGAFLCGEEPDHLGQHHCLLRTCQTNNDCPPPVVSQPSGKVKYEFRCEPSAGEQGVSYCRRLENYDFPCNQGQCPLGKPCDGQTNTCPAYAVCPAPTCDCPSRLDEVVTIRDLNPDSQELALAVRNFRCMATVGTTGSSVERGLQAIRRFIERDRAKDADQRFMRNDAHLVIAILSDEDDCSGRENLPEGVGLPGCVWFKDMLTPVPEFVDQVKKLKSKPYEVVVASIVGVQTLFCADACPAMEGGHPMSCVDSDDCPADMLCEPPSFCARRVFLYDDEQGKGEEPQHSCASANGMAYSGDRYIDFTKAFGEHGIDLSICQESFASALDSLAKLIERIEMKYCLSKGLTECRSDADCRESATMGKAVCRSYWSKEAPMGTGHCVLANGTLEPGGGTCQRDADCSAEGARCDIRNICRWDDAHGGDPADLLVTLQRAGEPAPSVLNPVTDWELVPTPPFGCIEFAPDKMPTASDEVDIRYVSGVKL